MKRSSARMVRAGAVGVCGGDSNGPTSKNTGQKNKRMMKRIVDSGEVPGILVYADGIPIGWCSVASREAYPVLERSRTLKRIDDEHVWSVVCFFVARPFRRKSLMTSLLEAATRYAKKHGAKIVEGYPVEQGAPYVRVRGLHRDGVHVQESGIR